MSTDFLTVPRTCYNQISMNLAVNARVTIDHQMKDHIYKFHLGSINLLSKGMYRAAEKPKYFTSDDLVLSDAEYHQTKGYYLFKCI